MSSVFDLSLSPSAWQRGNRAWYYRAKRTDVPQLSLRGGAGFGCKSLRHESGSFFIETTLIEVLVYSVITNGTLA